MENVNPVKMNGRLTVSHEEKRSHLNELLNRIAEIETSDSDGLTTALQINSVLKDLHLLEEDCPVSDRLQNADETFLDAKVICSSSSLVLKCLEGVDTMNVVYEPGEFVSAIKNFITNDDPEEFTHQDFSNLIADADEIIREVPEFSPLYGTYDITKLPEKKVRKERAKKPKEEHVQKKQLIKVVKADEEEQGIDSTITFLNRVLNAEYEKNGREPIDYYRYVIDTEDFGQTVQNIFYTSFLVRDGKAKLSVDEGGLATLQPMTRLDLKNFRKQNKEHTQLITSITMDEWEKFNFEEGLLQHYKNET